MKEIQRFAGVDWATRSHAVCVIDPDGSIRARFEVANTGKSFNGLIKRLVKLRVQAVAIERPDGPFVEALLDAGLEVYVIPPRQLKALRTRYGAAGAKSDPGDAYVLADVLRTDRQRLKPLTSDSAETKVLRALTRTRKDLIKARGACVLALLDAIEKLDTRSRELQGDIVERLELHRDAHIFTSLPKAGRGVRAASLLAEIGDARERFPDEESLAALAGVAPVTRASGKSHSVGFRWACDKKLRNALIDFADDSRHKSPWAARVYADAIARGKRHPHAIRILARAWVRVIWRMWQDGKPYDVTRHGGAAMLQAA